MTLGQRVSSLLCNLLARLMTFLLPRRGKRAVFLATIFVEISKVSPTHHKVLEIINDRLRIFDAPDAIHMAAMFHRVIWKDRHLIIRGDKATLTEEELDGICQRIINTIPAWAKYGSREQVMVETRQAVMASMEFKDCHA